MSVIAAMSTSVAESIPSESTAKLVDRIPIKIFEKAKIRFPPKAIQLAFRIMDVRFSIVTPPCL
jgi:hypothetical protein